MQVLTSVLFSTYFLRMIKHEKTIVSCYCLIRTHGKFYSFLCTVQCLIYTHTTLCCEKSILLTVISLKPHFILVRSCPMFLLLQYQYIIR